MGEISRRDVIRFGVLGLALLGTSRGVALAAAASTPKGDPVQFTEIYKGRRIRAISGRPTVKPAPRVFIDEVELHLMPVGAAGYTTMLNHFQVFRTARHAARAAVDGLNGAQLLPHR